MELIDDSFFEEYEFIYRLHPGHELSYRIDDRIRVISDLPIGEWLHSCQLYLTWGSTSAFEASAVGIPVVIHEPFPYKSKFKMCGLDEFETIRSIEELSDLELQGIASEQRESSIHEKYLGKSGSNVEENTVRADDETGGLERSFSCFQVSPICVQREKGHPLYKREPHLVVRQTLCSILPFKNAK